MKTVYAMKLCALGKRPSTSTPVEPMLVQIGNGEALLLFPVAEIGESAFGNIAALASAHLPLELDLDSKCKVVDVNIKPPDMVKRRQECVLTFSVALG